MRMHHTRNIPERYRAQLCSCKKVEPESWQHESLRAAGAGAAKGKAKAGTKRKAETTAGGAKGRGKKA